MAEGPRENEWPWWSADGNVLYYVSDREVNAVLWAQELDPTTRQPVGEPVAVHSLGDPQLSMPHMSSGGRITVAGNRLVLSLVETTGNIWIMAPVPAPSAEGASEVVRP